MSTQIERYHNQDERRGKEGEPSSLVVKPRRNTLSCELCQELFPLEEIYYIQGDHGYTRLCDPCCEKPEAQCFLPYMERLRRGLLSDDEIANWNAIHDM